MNVIYYADFHKQLFYCIRSHIFRNPEFLSQIFGIEIFHFGLDKKSRISGSPRATGIEIGILKSRKNLEKIPKIVNSYSFIFGFFAKSSLIFGIPENWDFLNLGINLCIRNFCEKNTNKFKNSFFVIFSHLKFIEFFMFRACVRFFWVW